MPSNELVPGPSTFVSRKAIKLISHELALFDRNLLICFLVIRKGINFYLICSKCFSEFFLPVLNVSVIAET